MDPGNKLDGVTYKVMFTSSLGLVNDNNPFGMCTIFTCGSWDRCLRMSKVKFLKHMKSTNVLAKAFKEVVSAGLCADDRGGRPQGPSVEDQAHHDTEQRTAGAY